MTSATFCHIKFPYQGHEQKGCEKNPAQQQEHLICGDDVRFAPDHVGDHVEGCAVGIRAAIARRGGVKLLA